MSAEMARRVRAARAYGGYSSRGDLAGPADIGVDTIKRIEKGTRDPRQGELLAIARACELPPEFFTVDFARLSELDEGEATTPESLEAAMARILSMADPEVRQLRLGLRRLLDAAEDAEGDLQEGGHAGEQ